MITKKHTWACVLAGLALSAAPALATVTVDFIQQDATITGPGNTALVDVVASFSEPVVGWAMTLNIADDTVADVTDIIIGGDWMGAPAEPLSGLTLAPAGITGTTTLATLEFTGLAPGVTAISLEIDGESQGFALNPPPGNAYDADVTLHAGTITVVPEPASLALVALGTLLLRRRR